MFKNFDPVETSTFAQLDKEKIFFKIIDDILEVKKFIVKKMLCTVFCFFIFVMYN